MPQVSCYISLGSNLKRPLYQLNQAKKSIAEMPATELCQCSSIYQSVALTLDDESQADYLNAVVQLNTTLTAEQLLNELQSIEQKQGRVREKRWGARTIDLDILLYGQDEINTVRLAVPHPEMEVRNFVLLPLMQIAPELSIPAKGALKALLVNLNHSGLKKVGEFNE